MSSGLFSCELALRDDGDQMDPVSDSVATALRQRLQADSPSWAGVCTSGNTLLKVPPFSSLSSLQGTQFRHQDALSAKTLAQGFHCTGGTYKSLSQSSRVPLGCWEGLSVEGSGWLWAHTAFYIWAPKTCRSSIDWSPPPPPRFSIFLYFFKRNLWQKSRECRRVDIAWDWEPGCFKSLDSQRHWPWVILSVSLTCSHLETAHVCTHACSLWMLRLKKTTCVGRLWGCQNIPQI